MNGRTGRRAGLVSLVFLGGLGCALDGAALPDDISKHSESLFERSVEHEGVLVEAKVSASFDRTALSVSLELVDDEGAFVVRFGVLDGNATTVTNGKSISEARRGALEAFAGVVEPELSSTTASWGGVLRGLVSWLAEAPAGHIFPRELASFAVVEQEIETTDGFRAYSLANDSVCVYPSSAAFAGQGQSYTASWDTPTGGTRTESKRATTSGEWYTNACLGSCGPGCPGTLLNSGRWGLDCMEHDMCLWYNGGSALGDNPKCGDEYNDAYSDFVSTGCSAPFRVWNLAGVSSPSGATVTWTPPTLTSAFVLYRGSNCGGTVISSTIAATTSSYVDTASKPGFCYTYSMKTRTNSAYSTCSSNVTACRPIQ